MSRETTDGDQTLAEESGVESILFEYGCRGNPTPAVDVHGALLIINYLRTKSAARIRSVAIDVLVKFLGGSEDLVQQTLANRAEQARLAAEDPENPMRLFGQDVEAREGDASIVQQVDAAAIERVVTAVVEKAVPAVVGGAMVGAMESVMTVAIEKAMQFAVGFKGVQETEEQLLRKLEVVTECEKRARSWNAEAERAIELAERYCSVMARTNSELDREIHKTGTLRNVRQKIHADERDAIGLRAVEYEQRHRDMFEHYRGVGYVAHHHPVKEAGGMYLMASEAERMRIAAMVSMVYGDETGNVPQKVWSNYFGKHVNVYPRFFVPRIEKLLLDEYCLYMES